MDGASQMNYLTQLEQMLESGYRILSIETYDTDRVADLFTQLSRFSNKAYYLSSPKSSMYRIGASHIAIPRTQNAKDLLEHIDGSQHFGVFILRDFGQSLEETENVKLLHKIATSDIDKVVLLLSESIELPKALKPYTLRSKHQMKKAV